MNTIQPLEYDSYFHIYNRGINGENLFRENSNYEHFLRLFIKYSEPIAEIYAWCLLKNHFHMLVRILPENEIEYMKTMEGDQRIFQHQKRYDPSRQFANLFNAYAKAYNKKYGRTGGLFETPFRRIKVTNENYFEELVFYIHNNPVKHGFVTGLADYPWPSYLSIISLAPTKTKREKVVGWFNSESEFIEYHGHKQETSNFIPFEFELED